MEDTPVNAAHAFANAAEEFEEKEQWGKAMEAHFRAAEQFLLAMNYTLDPEEHPSTSSHHKKSPAQSKSNAAVPSPKSNTSMRTQQHLQGSSSHPNSQHAVGMHTSSNSNGRMTPDLLRSGVSSTSARLASDVKGTRQTQTWSDSLTSVAPGVSLDESAVTEKTIDESYMDDDMDPFNKFWEIVESLVSKVSNPVAFATAPLNGTDPRTLLDPGTIHTFGNNTDVENGRIPHPESLKGYYRTNKNVPTKTLEEYAMENQQLKSTLDIMSKRMQAHEKAAEENSMLRSSILQFKNDFQKQAKRIKASQEMLRSMSIMKQTSPESSTVGNVQLLQRRVKELEEELRIVKIDNQKQKDLMTKYRERWEKLKESAKKRRVNKQGDPATHQIVEPSSSPKTPTPDSVQSHKNPQDSSPPSPHQNPSLIVLPSSSVTMTATTITTAIVAPESRKQSLPEISLPFALQKSPQKPGFGEILDGSTGSKGSVGASQKKPNTTIVHAIGTSSTSDCKNSSVSDNNNNKNSSNNSARSLTESNSTMSSLPFMSQQEPDGSFLPTGATESSISPSNQRGLTPADESLSPSSSMVTAVTSISPSIYQQ
ncbi:15115_t:CDS:10 [Acaulospora colombiana]|uniref:15115_t:CDS:1 n=1 Tax=Acaulospora colombiana TaxID=27376 RepID=A0ACA9L7E2_9GLOM|nr:15115_t:CDS:10 [Acaulospora colombiana]